MQKFREFIRIVAMALVTLPATRRPAFSQMIGSPTIHSLQPDDLPWNEKTKRDLAFIKSALLENHPATGGLKDKAFERWFFEGYAEAVHRADTVSNLPGYFFTLKHFVNGFADFHLRVGFSSFEIPNLIHIGLPTDADSIYNQIRDFEFANGTMSLELPILKIENGKRKNNEAYEPKILWPGEIDDTPAIEKLIKELVP